MGIRETPTSEIRHRIGFDPNDVVEDPITEILQGRADTIDVVVAPDDPKRAVVLQDAVALVEPLPRELIVGVKPVEFVPILFHAVDPAIVRPTQFAAELQIVWRVREDHIDGTVRQRGKQFEGIAQ